MNIQYLVISNRSSAALLSPVLGHVRHPNPTQLRVEVLSGSTGSNQSGLFA